MAKFSVRIEAVKPRSLPDAKIFADNIERQYDITAREVARDLEAITATWKHKVKFTIRKTKRQGRLGITITTKDKIFNYVNKGTEPHVITPVKSSMLAFKSGYNAKTRPGWIGSQQGGPFGGTVFAKQVNHPGTEARKFDVAIARRRQKSLQSRVNQVIAKANRKRK